MYVYYILYKYVYTECGPNTHTNGRVRERVERGARPCWRARDTVVFFSRTRTHEYKITAFSKPSLT